MISGLGQAGQRRAQVILAGIFVPFAAWTVLPMLDDVVQKPNSGDFRLLYAAARLGLAYGWSHLYDPGLQVAVMGRLQLFFQPFLNPPVAAWLALPLSFLPFTFARVTWTAILLAALGGAWWLLRPLDGSRPRVLWLLGFLALFPAAFSIGIGQTQVLVLLAFAVAVRLRSSGHEGWAGAALAVVWLKPQLAFLLPVALVAARQWRMLLGLAVAGGLLGLVQVLALGPSGVHQYLLDLQVASTWDLQRRLSLAGLVPGWLFLVLRVVVVGLLLLASSADRKADHALIAAPLASLLVTPYSGFQDLALLAGVAWIWLRVVPDGWVRVWLLVGWVAAEFTLVWGPWPVVAFQLAWMVLLALLGAQRLGWLSALPVAGRGAPRPGPRSAAPAGPDRAGLP